MKIWSESIFSHTRLKVLKSNCPWSCNTTSNRQTSRLTGKGDKRISPDAKGTSNGNSACNFHIRAWPFPALPTRMNTQLLCPIGLDDERLVVCSPQEVGRGV